MRTDTLGSRTLLPDGGGSVIAETTASGAVATVYSYEPFGEHTEAGIATGNVNRFTGRPADGTGLFFHRARYYAPAHGRFISEDPMGVDAGPNLYAYVDNSPTNFTDTDGLYKLKNVPPEKTADIAAAMELLKQTPAVPETKAENCSTK
jgi:RHS repeat-associated protein